MKQKPFRCEAKESTGLSRGEDAKDARLVYFGLVEQSPDDLPGVLTALDVRVVIGAGPPRLRWPARLAPFMA